MIDLSAWNLLVPGLLLLFLLGILMARGFGVIKLDWLNSKWLRELRKMQSATKDLSRKVALETIMEHCQLLNSKWILEESDLNILENTYGLIEQIARSYHPKSNHPVEEARIRWVLQAFMDLKNRLLALTTWKGVHAVTQFRIHHILLLSKAWKLKDAWKEWPAVKFLTRHGLYPLFRWVFYIIRWLNLTFWAIKMMAYIIQDIIFKVFLVRWYLVVGELAIQVYQDREKEPEVRAEEILEDFDSMPESESPLIADLPKESTIRDCIEKRNLTQVEDVTKVCEAGGNCQSCHILIQLFIDQYQAEKNLPPLILAQSGASDKKRGFFSRLFTGLS